MRSSSPNPAQHAVQDEPAMQDKPENQVKLEHQVKPENQIRPAVKDSGGFEDVAVGGIVLTSSFITATLLLLIALLMPGLFLSQTIPTILWFWGSALAAGVLDIVVSRLGLGLWLHMAVFMVTQWAGWWVRIRLVMKLQVPFLFNPVPLVRDDWEWIVTVAILWWTVVIYSRILNRLSRIPQSYSKPLGTGWEDVEYKPNLSLWEKDWRTWRTMVLLLMFVAVLGFMIWFPLTGSRAIQVGGLLFVQIILGFALIATGFFLYRRAFWQADGFAPDARFRRIWRRGTALLLFGPAIIGLILPGSFRKLDEWWLFRGLGRLLRKGNPEGIGNPPALENLTERLDQSRNLMEPGLLMTIMAYLLGVPVLILLVVGILLVFVLSVVYLLDRLKLIPGEMVKLKGIRGLIIQLYLRWLKFWRRRRAKGFLRWRNRDTGRMGAAHGSKKTKSRQSLGWGRGPKAMIRRGYFRFVGHARARGFRFNATLTPREIAAGLAPLLPGEENSLAEITKSYHEARYGPEEPEPERARLFEELRRMLQGRMRWH